MNGLRDLVAILMEDGWGELAWNVVGLIALLAAFVGFTVLGWGYTA